MEIHQRLEIFQERLRAAPACHTAEEALALVCRLIEEIEDEFCPIPRQHPPPRTRTGRMYAPQGDSIFREPKGGIRVETRRHTMYFSPDGSFSITQTTSGEVEFSKSSGTL